MRQVIAIEQKKNKACLGVLLFRFEAGSVVEKSYNDGNSSNRWEVCWRCAGVFKSLSQTPCYSVLSYKSFNEAAK
jgi:hypothetical protein